MFATLLCVAACGGDRGASGLGPRASAKPETQKASGSEAALPEAGGPKPEASPALPARTCPKAHAATLGSCSDGLRCLLLLEISETCTVTIANELDIPDEALESDGGGIQDIAWPKKDGPIFLVNGVETWSWAELPSPLTAARDALTKVTWTPAKVGEMEPEGYQYGLATDGQKAILVGCATWGDDCGPDAEECEEWDCRKHVFVDPHTKKKLAKAPALPYVGATTTGKVAETVTIAKKGKKLTCASGTAAAEEWYEDSLDGSLALSPTDWLAVRYRSGSRMSAEWDIDITYMTGCEPARGLEGSLRLGPTTFWARATDTGWALQHGPRAAALSDATGKVSTFGDGHFVWTSE